MARRSGRAVAFVRIAGVGTVINSVALPYFFCTARPRFATSAQWQPLLTSLPETIAERIDPMGGVREAGAFTFELADTAAGLLLSALRWETDPVAEIATAVGIGDVSINVTDGSQLPVDQLLWVAGECMRVTGGVLPARTVQRGRLATEITGHEIGDPIYNFTRRLEGRSVSLYLCPYDADAFTSDNVDLSAAAHKVGDFTIQRVDYTEGFAGFRFSCASSILQLKRTVGRAARGELEVVNETNTAAGNHFLQVRSTLGPTPPTVSVWPEAGTGYPTARARRYLLVDGKEIISAYGTTSYSWGAQLYELQRGKLGTQPIEDIRGKLIRPILLAYRDEGIGDFRVHPTGATSRSTAGWESEDHFVDILLCLLTSSARVGDGLELVNCPGGGPNWSSLPAGWGAGVRYSRINLDSFRLVKDRYPEWRFPRFMLTEPVRLGKLLVDQFLRVLGAFIAIGTDGRLELRVPRMPYEGEAGALFDPSNVLAIAPNDRGLRRPTLEGGFEPSGQIRGVLFTLKNAAGGEVKTLVGIDAFGGAAARDALEPGAADDILDMDVPGAMADQSGIEAFLEELAVRKAFRHRFPPRVLTCFTDLTAYPRGLGELVSLTWPTLPDHRRGQRGVTNAPHLVIEKALSLNLKGSDPPGYKFTLWGRPGDRIGRIAPAANITAWNGGTFRATVTEVRFTDADAGRLGLPLEDVNSFRVGMLVRLRNANGTLVAGTAAVEDLFPATNEIALSDDFGLGAGMVGRILVPATFDASQDEEQAAYVADADRATGTIGASSTPAWRYGEV